MLFTGCGKGQVLSVERIFLVLPEAPAEAGAGTVAGYFHFVLYAYIFRSVNFPTILRPWLRIYPVLRCVFKLSVVPTASARVELRR
ncbi:hypothetical protein U1Q18_050003, partial [Sarracenia purpurea var. burkii]